MLKLNTFGLMILAAVADDFLLSLPVMWLWNGCLVPASSGIHEIGWLQAWGLTILCSFLFKSHKTSATNN